MGCVANLSAAATADVRKVCSDDFIFKACW
jgi:hypothetical protein